MVLAVVSVTSCNLLLLLLWRAVDFPTQLQSWRTAAWQLSTTACSVCMQVLCLKTISFICYWITGQWFIGRELTWSGSPHLIFFNVFLCLAFSFTEITMVPVSLVTRLWAGWSGSWISAQAWQFCLLQNIRLALGPNQHPVQSLLRFFPMDKAARVWNCSLTSIKCQH